jgi:hypothetical protein
VGIVAWILKKLVKTRAYRFYEKQEKPLKINELQISTQQCLASAPPPQKQGGNTKKDVQF